MTTKALTDFGPTISPLVETSGSPFVRAAIYQDGREIYLPLATGGKSYKLVEPENMWACAVCLSRLTDEEREDISLFTEVYVSSAYPKLFQSSCSKCLQLISRTDILSPSVQYESLKDWPDRRFWTFGMMKTAYFEITQALQTADPSHDIPEQYRAEAARIRKAYLPAENFGMLRSPDNEYLYIKELLTSAWPYVRFRRQHDYGVYHMQERLKKNPFLGFANGSDCKRPLPSSSR